MENATIQDLLIFITTCDVTPPCGFGQKLSIFLTEKSCLATASTCGLSMTIPLGKTRQRTVLAITSGKNSKLAAKFETKMYFSRIMCCP